MSAAAPVMQVNRGPGSSGAPNGGLNFLIPLAFEPQWTGLDEVFNAYPPPPPQATAAAIAAAQPVTQVPAPGMVNGSIPVPFGTAPQWLNPTTCSVVPLVNSTGGQILPANLKRNLLIVKNNTASGGANMFINFGQSASVNSLQLAPGQGLVLDVICPSDAVYVAWSAIGGSGVVIQGAFSPNPAPSIAYLMMGEAGYGGPQQDIVGPGSGGGGGGVPAAW